MSRACGLCPTNVQSFYENLQKLYDQHGYSVDRIWNADESRAQVGRNGGALVVARIGSRFVHKVMPDERELISILYCVNANRASISNFYIFKGKGFRRNYIKACETGATMAIQPRI